MSISILRNDYQISDLLKEINIARVESKFNLFSHEWLRGDWIFRIDCFTNGGCLEYDHKVAWNMVSLVEECHHNVLMDLMACLLVLASPSLEVHNLGLVALVLASPF